MRLESALEKAVERYDYGDLDGAIAIAEKFLEKRPANEWVGKYAKAYLYLSVFHRWKGNYEVGSRILEEIIRSATCSALIHAQALIERAYMSMGLRMYDEALRSLNLANSHIEEQGLVSDQGQESLKLLYYYHITRGVVLSRQGHPAKALEDYHHSMDCLISLQSCTDNAKEQITVCLNVYSAQMVLGNVNKATEYLTLAHAKMLTLNTPYAFGLIHFFENLAAHNLFAAGSQDDAIQALNHISEEVVNSFADSRKVFDFFSSIIVQLHDGKFDLGQIREGIRAYGDDELIKAYLPVLLAGAPPPGDDDPDDTIPAARLMD